MKYTNTLFINSAVAFFFLFFLHGTSIGNGQQGISYNVKALAMLGIKESNVQITTNESRKHKSRN